MSGQDEISRFDEVDSVGRRLQASRPQLDAFELDNLKMRVLRRGGHNTTKGASVKARIVVAVLSLGLLGAGAGGVVAASGGASNGASSAQSQYVHCGKGTHRVGNHCVANHHPPHCRKGTHPDHHGGCVADRQKPKCGRGTHPHNGRCVANKPHPRHFCKDHTHYSKKHHGCVADKPKHHHTIRQGIRRSQTPSGGRRRGFTG